MLIIQINTNISVHVMVLYNFDGVTECQTFHFTLHKKLVKLTLSLRETIYLLLLQTSAKRTEGIPIKLM